MVQIIGEYDLDVCPFRAEKQTTTNREGEVSRLLGGGCLTSLDPLTLLNLVMALLAFDLTKQNLRLSLYLRHEPYLLSLLSVIRSRSRT